MASRLTSIIFRFCIILVLCATVGCGSRLSRRPQQATACIPIRVIQPYTMHVDGVECKYCAQMVLDIVKKLPGVSNVQYHTSDATYQDSYLTCMVDETYRSIEENKGQLMAGLEQEGFTLTSMENRSRPFDTIPSRSLRESG